MNIFGRAAGFSRLRLGKLILVSLLSLALLFAAWPQKLSAYQDAPSAAPQAAQAPPYTQQTPEQLQQLVAPIALYPDSLVAQVLAASTFPEEVVEADRWVQANPDLKGDALGQAVDQQPWDPSVKALAAFPSVLGNMDKNLSWTSSLGDAYYNQQPDVMDAVQVMRRRAQEAGNLKTTPQQTVTTQGSTIVVQPADPDVVYVPAYDPWLVYGDPIWRGRDGTRIPESGLAARTSRSDSASESASSAVLDGAGVIGDSIGVADYAMYGGGRYYSRSNTFYNRSNYYRGGGERGGVSCAAPRRSDQRCGGGRRRGGVSNRSGATARAFNGNRQAAEDTLNPAVRAASARAPSAATGGRTDQELFVTRKRQLRWRSACGGGGGSRRRWRRSIAAVVAGIGNRSFVMFLVASKIWKWREAICGERS